MAARRGGTKSGSRKTQDHRRKKASRPALGNDPFERGAAVREAAPAPEAAPEPASRTDRAPAATSAPAAAAEAAPAAQPIDSSTAQPINAQAPEAPAQAHATAVAAPDVDSLRGRLSALEARVESAATAAATRLRELARHEASGQATKDLLQTCARLVPALYERLGAVAALRDLFTGRRELDAFGMDRELFARTMPLLEFLYTSWWRVEPRSIENVPAEGPVIVVANHGGALPWDALVLRLAVLRDHPARRELRPLLDEHALGVPVAGTAASRLGAVPATPENALGILRDGGAIAVFPEGSRAALRPWSQRYRIERFGRGGFAKVAFRAGAAVVPCAIVGSEETSAPFARAGWLAEALGLPFLTSAPALPLAPLGLIPLPSRWSLRFGDAVETAAAGPGAADDPARVLELTERCRASLQQMLDDDVAARRSVYL